VTSWFLSFAQLVQTVQITMQLAFGMDFHTTNSFDDKLSQYGRVMQLFQTLTYHTNVFVIPEYEMFKDKVIFKSTSYGETKNLKLGD
jgi:hypothetical protein